MRVRNKTVYFLLKIKQYPFAGHHTYATVPPEALYIDDNPSYSIDCDEIQQEICDSKEIAKEIARRLSEGEM